MNKQLSKKNEFLKKYALKSNMSFHDFCQEFLENAYLNNLDLEKINIYNLMQRINSKKLLNGKATFLDKSDATLFFKKVFSKNAKGAFSQEGDDINECIKNNLSDFIHVRPFGVDEKIECRLYLNLQADKIIKVANKIAKYSCKAGKRFYYKFYTNDSRNDSFLIYTSYNNADFFIETLKSIKEKNPEWFAGCEKTNPALQLIEGFIGFGEEPVYKHSSYNYERSQIIKEYIKEKLSEERKNMTNSNIYIKNSLGQKLNLQDYIVYRLKQEFKNEIANLKNNVKNKKSIMHINNINEYEKLLNHVEQDIKENKFPLSKIKEMEKYAKQAVLDLKNGKRLESFDTKIFSKNKEIVKNPKFYQKDSDDKIGLPICITGIMEKLYKTFDVYSKIVKNPDEALMKKLCDAHHVSYKNLALNTETEKELSLNKEIIK